MKMFNVHCSASEKYVLFSPGTFVICPNPYVQSVCDKRYDMTSAKETLQDGYSYLSRDWACAGL